LWKCFTPIEAVSSLGPFIGIDNSADTGTLNGRLFALEHAALGEGLPPTDE